MQRHATQSVVIGELYRTPALKLFVRAEPDLGPTFEAVESAVCGESAAMSPVHVSALRMPLMHLAVLHARIALRLFALQSSRESQLSHYALALPQSGW